MAPLHEWQWIQDHKAHYLRDPEAAHAECRVQVGRFGHQATARDLIGGERERYWRMMVSFWPDYASYQNRTDRLIPVVQLVAERDE